MTLATLYSDDAGTAQANPFTASSTGYYSAYIAEGRYDVRFSAGGISTPFTLGDFMLGGPTVNCNNFPGASASAKINNCITAIPATGGVADARLLTGSQTIAATITITKPVTLLLGAGTYAGSVNPLISITANGSQIICLGAGTTTIDQTSTGNAINITNASDINNITISGCSIDGSGTGGVGIYTQQVKDSVFEHNNINNFTSHAIDFTGVDNVNNVVQNNRITGGSASAAAGRGVNARQGNRLRVSNNYLNLGGTRTTATITAASNATPIAITTSAAHGFSTGNTAVITGVLGNVCANGVWTITSTGATTFTLTSSVGCAAYISGGTAYVRATGYDTALDLRGSGATLSDGNIIDGTIMGIRCTTPCMSYGDWIDESTANILVPGAYVFEADNNFVVSGPTNVTDANILTRGTASAFTDLRYLSFYGADAFGNTGGMIRANAITPAQITGDQNNYSPADSSILDGCLASVWRLSSDATRTITGIRACAPGHTVNITNVGSNPIIFRNQNASSAAANQILTEDDTDVLIRGNGASGANETVTFQYDGTVTNWRVVKDNRSQPRQTDFLSPATITASQNDYFPTSGVAVHFLALTSNGAYNITGLDIAAFSGQASSGIGGYTLTLMNRGTATLSLTNQDASSTAVNRIITGTGATIAIDGDESATLAYDTAVSRWRVIGVNP